MHNYVYGSLHNNIGTQIERRYFYPGLEPQQTVQQESRQVHGTMEWYKRHAGCTKGSRREKGHKLLVQNEP